MADENLEVSCGLRNVEVVTASELSGDESMELVSVYGYIRLGKQSERNDACSA